MWGNQVGRPGPEAYECLHAATARLNTLVRFARWSEARAQGRLLRGMLDRLLRAGVLPGEPAMLAAEQGLKELRSRGGFLAQLGCGLVDLFLCVVFVATVVPGFVLFDEFGLLLAIVELPILLGISSANRGNPFLHGDSAQNLLQ